LLIFLMRHLLSRENEFPRCTIFRKRGAARFESNTRFL